MPAALSEIRPTANPLVALNELRRRTDPIVAAIDQVGLILGQLRDPWACRTHRLDDLRHELEAVAIDDREIATLTPVLGQRMTSASRAAIARHVAMLAGNFTGPLARSADVDQSAYAAVLCETLAGEAPTLWGLETATWAIIRAYRWPPTGGQVVDELAAAERDCARRYHAVTRLREFHDRTLAEIAEYEAAARRRIAEREAKRIAPPADPVDDDPDALPF